jgi:hypothetical protein
LTAVGGVLLMLPAIARGQQTPAMQVRSGSCDVCKVESTLLARIGDTTGPGMVSDQGRIWLDSRNRLYVGGPKQGSVVKVYDSAGRYLRTIGRAGRGPGEFTSPYVVGFSGNRVTHVFDVIPHRWVVFDSGYRALSTTTLPFAPVAAVMLSADLAILTGESHGRETIGYPLHLFSRSRGLVRSFGVDRPIADPRRPQNITRIIAPAAGGRVWATRGSAYEIELFDTLGVRRSRIVRDVPWFRPWTSDTSTGLESRTQPFISDIREDGSGLLWVLLNVPDAAWQPREGVLRPGGMIYIPDTTKELIYDTIVEVIDPASGQLLVSRRFPEYFRKFAGERVIYRYTEDEASNPYYVVHRLTLVGRVGTQGANR